MLTLDKPNAVLPLLPIPIVPEHIWKDVDEKEVKSYANEPTDGQPVVGSGPVPMVEGTAGGSTYRFVINPDYWGEGPYVDQVVFQVYKSEDPMVQALIKGEIDFAEDITALQVDPLQDEPGITAHNGDLADLRRDRRSTPARSTLRPASRSATRTRRSWTRRSATRSRTRSTGADRRDCLPGRRDPRVDTSSRRRTPTWHWDPGEDEAFTFDLDKAAEMLDDAGYTLGSTASGPCRTARPSAPCGCSPAPSRTNSVDTMDLFQGGSAELGIDAEVTAMDSDEATKSSSTGSTTPSSGTGTSNPTRTASSAT